MRICRKAGCVWITESDGYLTAFGPLWSNMIWEVSASWTHVDQCVHAKLLQSSLTLRDPMDCSLPGSSVSGIFQARILKWVVISFSRGSSRPRDWTCASCIAGRFFTAEPPGKPHADQSQWQKPVSTYQWQPLGFCTRKISKFCLPRHIIGKTITSELWGIDLDCLRVCRSSKLLEPEVSIMSWWCQRNTLIRRQCSEEFHNEMEMVQDFPGGPGVNAVHFHCRGHRFHPWLETKWIILTWSTPSHFKFPLLFSYTHCRTCRCSRKKGNGSPRSMLPREYREVLTPPSAGVFFFPGLTLKPCWRAAATHWPVNSGCVNSQLTEKELPGLQMTVERWVSSILSGSTD